MPDCPTCGKRLDDTIRFCPDDGTPLTDTPTVQRGSDGTSKSNPRLELPLLIGNRYRLVEVRGGGGMATVYRALDTTLEREVAVKLINADLREDPEFDSRFQREARIASQLSDPHIIVVHDSGFDSDHGPYIVMEFLQGQSLREHLQARGPMDVKAALQVSTQLLLALIHAHEKGIIHRDIKPDNIFLLNQSGVRLHVRVLDFGIARIYRRDEPAHAETLTRPGAVLGTPRYMSPEQLAGQPLDARSDLYSAALVIHEAMTGTLPYVSRKSLRELCPDAPLPLTTILDQCLLQNPAERPASATEVYLKLQEPCKASSVVVLSPGELDRMVAARHGEHATQALSTSRSVLSRWPRARLAAVLILCVTLLGFAGWAFKQAYSAHKSGAGSDREAVLGLEIGQSRDDVVLRYLKPDEKWSGDPWKGEARKVIGHVVKPDLLGDFCVCENLEVLGWSKHGLYVLLDKDENIVQGIVVRDPKAVTKRHLRIGDGTDDMYRRYPGDPKIEIRQLDAADVQAGGPHQVEIYRYDALGIGFEARAGKIQAIALYPPQTE